ncbi:MAG: 4-hydroxythreonine-4-phosphate dehydrogenase PdxA [Cohaesibacteraceae bacterium]
MSPQPASLRQQPLALSMGEPAGVGPDIILATCQSLSNRPGAPSFVVFGDPELLASRARTLGITVSVQLLASTADVTAIPKGTLQVVRAGSPVDDRPGQLDPTTGPATVAALDAALDAVHSGQCSGLVTAPIHKANLYQAGFIHPGHTEYLEEKAQTLWGADKARAIMMLAGPALRTVPVTVHVPLSAVHGDLTQEAIVTAGRVTARDLTDRFGLSKPRLAVAGLNPHAGEAGTIGHEDDAVIAPAVRQLQAEGFDAFGPLPADTLFHEEARQGYDAALCMYHDQALIPVKALDFHNTVNVTLGLPFIRTSPDHGTALDLAGTGKASPQSMIAAIEMADAMAQRASHERDAA